MTWPAHWRLAHLLLVLLVTITVAISTVGMSPKRSSADVTSDTLQAEGGSLAQPIVDKLETDGASTAAPLALSYFDADVDQARTDFAAGNQGTSEGVADFAVSELPLTAAESATAAANGRTFAYVPFAASPIAIGAIVECERDLTLLPTTLCPDLQVTVAQLAGLFTQSIGYWNSSQLSMISCPTPTTCGPIAPFAQGAEVIPEYLASPAASTEALIALFDANPAAAAVWASFISSLKGTNDAPTETWPTNSGVHGGDQEIAQSLIPIDVTTLVAQPDPQEWGLGEVAPLAADWIGPPENIPTIAVQNSAGAYVSPTVAAATAALKDATLDPSTNLVTFQNSSTDTAAYPLMVMSYLVVPTSGLPVSKAAALASFIRFVLSSKGQADVSSLGAAPVTTAMTNAGLAVANEVADSAASFSITVNGSASSATISPGETATLAVVGLSSGDTGTVSFTSGTTPLCTITLPATNCATPATLSQGTYGKITASYVYGNGIPGITATNTVSLTVTTASTSATTTTTTTPKGVTTSESGGSNGGASDSGGSSGSLAFTGASDVVPFAALGGALILGASYGRRRLRRRTAK